MMRSIKRQLGVESVELLDEIDPPVEEEVPPEMDATNMDSLNLDDFDLGDVDLGDFSGVGGEDA